MAKAPWTVGALREGLNFESKTSKSVDNGECPSCGAPALRVYAGVDIRPKRAER
jgi:hypothetical protein